MSVKRLNAEERVVYAVGKVIVEYLKQETRIPDEQREINTLVRLLEAKMSPEDFQDFSCETGIIGQELYDEIMGSSLEEPQRGPLDDQDVPEQPFVSVEDARAREHDRNHILDVEPQPSIEDKRLRDQEREHEGVYVPDVTPEPSIEDKTLRERDERSHCEEPS